MTISYTSDVANASKFGVFTSILIRWKGSVYKLVYKEMLAFMAVYFSLNIFYRTILKNGKENEFYRNLFEGLKAYCSIQMSSIPMTFVLGFYVSLIVKRWWDQYNLLPWPDSLAIYIAGLLHGEDEKGRLMRRNIMRYFQLAYVITLRRVSLRVNKRFPTMEHVIAAGLMRSDELKCMEDMDDKSTVSKWWMPLVWATNIVDRARQENRIKSDPGMQTILQEISRIRYGLTGVQIHDSLSVPLVYTQVVTLSVYFYFLAALMGAQWVEPKNPADYAATYNLPTFTYDEKDLSGKTYQSLDLFYPFFLTLQFAFYVGWLKVAETLINPFGEDDDDFELNYLIDRHMQVSYMIVDDMFQIGHPDLLKDTYWNQVVPAALPYTADTIHYRKDEPRGSAENKDDEQIYLSKSQINYPLFNVKLSGSKAAGLDLEPNSDYEAVDTNLIGWWKNKIRKSQIRRSLRSLSSNVNVPTGNTGHQSLHQRPYHRRSSKSGGGIYAKLMSVATHSRSRKTSLSSTSGSIIGDEKKLVSNGWIEHSIRSQADIDSDLTKIYGDPKMRINLEPNPVNSRKAGELDTELLVDKLRNMSHLSTITENSPYSTHMGSRRNSHYPTATAIFDGHEKTSTNPDGSKSQEEAVSESKAEHISNKGLNPAILISGQPISENSSDCPYYPLGSEASMRPFTPNVRGEEVSSNYEPVLITNRGFAVSPVPPTPNPTPRAVPASPVLPKRSARMELDAINNKRPFSQKEKLPEVPELKKNNSLTGIINLALINQDEQKIDIENDNVEDLDDEDDEVFEEIQAPNEEPADSKVVKTENANSAFDNTAATFYV